MTGLENSGARRAQELRAGARRGLWRRLTAWLGINPHARRADAQAADCDAGAIGEQLTARLLQPLEAAGWAVLHDRAIPGAHSANADHLVVSPGARVFLVDSKMWSARFPVHGEGGSLWHGRVCRDKAIRSLLFETDLVSRAVRTVVQPVIAMHNAPVEDGGFFVQGIPVVPAGRLVEVLVANDGPRDPGAVWLAQHADRVLPRYR